MLVLEDFITDYGTKTAKSDMIKVGATLDLILILKIFAEIIYEETISSADKEYSQKMYMVQSKLHTAMKVLKFFDKNKSRKEEVCKKSAKIIYSLIQSHVAITGDYNSDDLFAFFNRSCEDDEKHLQMYTDLDNFIIRYR